MSKKWLLLIIPLSIVGVLALGVGALYLTLLDPTQSPYQAEEISTEDVFKRQLVRAFDKTAETGKIEYKIDQDCLNQVLYNSMKEAKKEMGEYSQYVGDVYVEIKDQNYTFYVNADAKLIKTRVKLFTTLTETKDDYVFTINGVNVGNLPTWSIIQATGVLNSFDLNSTFQSAGLNIKSDLPNGKLTYNKVDMMHDIRSMMSSSAGGETGDILTGVLDLMDLSFGFNGGISGVGDLTQLTVNNQISDSSSRQEELNNVHSNIIEPAVAKAKAAIKNGTPEDEAIETLRQDFAKIQTVLAEDKDINTLISERLQLESSETYVKYGVTGTDGEFKDVASVTEKEITDVLTSTGILGQSFIFNYKDEIAYAVIDQFYTDLFVKDEQPYLNLTIGINVNGYETHAIIQSKFTPSEDSFTAELDYSNGFFFGSKNNTGAFENAVKKYLDDAIADMVNGGGWESLQHVRGSSKITIDFDSLLRSNAETGKYMNLFNSLGEKRIHVSNINGSESPSADVGKLSIQFKSSGADVTTEAGLQWFIENGYDYSWMMNNEFLSGTSILDNGLLDVDEILTEGLVDVDFLVDNNYVTEDNIAAVLDTGLVDDPEIFVDAGIVDEQWLIDNGYIPAP